MVPHDYRSHHGLLVMRQRKKNKSTKLEGPPPNYDDGRARGEKPPPLETDDMEVDIWQMLNLGRRGLMMY